MGLFRVLVWWGYPTGPSSLDLGEDESFPVQVLFLLSDMETVSFTRGKGFFSLREEMSYGISWRPTVVTCTVSDTTRLPYSFANGRVCKDHQDRKWRRRAHESPSLQSVSTAWMFLWGIPKAHDKSHRPQRSISGDCFLYRMIYTHICVYVCVCERPQ